MVNKQIEKTAQAQQTSLGWFLCTELLVRHASSLSALEKGGYHRVVLARVHFAGSRLWDGGAFLRMLLALHLAHST